MVRHPQMGVAMFGFKRRRITAAVTQAMRPYVMIFQPDGPPPGFWEDEYVLGFFSSAIGLLAKLTSGTHASGSVLGYVLMDTLSTLSGVRASHIIQRVNGLLAAPTADYFAGVDAADKVFAEAYGLRAREHDPDVIQARKDAERITADSFGTEMKPAALLTKRLFYDVVVQRLVARHSQGG